MEKVSKKGLILKGIGVSPGIIVGKAYLIDRSKVEIAPYCLIDEGEINSEIERFKAAVEESKNQLLRVREKILEKEHKEILYIIDTHITMLGDKMLIENTINTIREEKIDAAWALKNTLQRINKFFNEISDEYLKERMNDIDYVGERILRNLVGKRQESIFKIPERVIVVARDLSPADTAQMDINKVMSFITDVGGKTSHTAIMARALEVPAVVALEKATQEINSGDDLIVDGTTGEVVVGPTPEMLEDFLKKQRRYQHLEEELFIYRDLPAETKDGYRIRLLANIELSEELPSVLKHGAEGIGLYRTEFLYLNRKELPTEEEHFKAYKEVVEKISPYPTTIRTFDLGGDKFISPLELAEEMNPAMGLRAIRFCLKEVEIFKVQLRAILRASAFGKVKILFPMVSGLDEIRKIKAILEELKSELKEKGVSYDPQLEIGIMIEIPSAVTIADLLAREVNFFSIGTNDLIQYSLAIDRVNEHVSYLYEPFHPAVLRIIKNVIEAAHGEGIRVAMCGEMAGEPLYLPILIGLGLDELSMNALSILWVKKILRSITYQEVREDLREIFKFSTAAEIDSFVRKKMLGRFSEDFLGLKVAS